MIQEQALNKSVNNKSIHYQQQKHWQSSSNAFTIISKEQASSCASAECAWGDECSVYLLPFEDKKNISEVPMMVSCGRKKEGNIQPLSRQIHIRAYLDINMAPGGGREGF